MRGANRGARIYAEVSGLGSSCNTSSWTEPDPSGAPLSRAIRFALRDAGIDASDVGLLCPLGTGTMDHDASEIAAFNEVFDGRIDEIPALTTRGAVGNNGTAGPKSMVVNIVANVDNPRLIAIGTPSANRMTKVRISMAIVMSNPRARRAVSFRSTVRFRDAIIL